MLKYRSYFIAVLSLLFALAATVVLMNWLVDPLDVYRVVRKEGFNSIKSSYIPYARLAKPSQTLPLSAFSAIRRASAVGR